VSVLPTHAFFYGLVPGQEITVDLEPGKTLVILCQSISDMYEDGSRLVFFELNGQPRTARVQVAVKGPSEARPKADLRNPWLPPCRASSPLWPWPSGRKSRRATSSS
jgi:pyruvate carboxylase